MKRIELEIVADNSQYIQSTKEVTQATQTMQKSVHKGEQRTKGLIEDTTAALKDYEEKRKKAFTIEGVEKYNKKIAEAKQTLEEYNKAGIETTKVQEKQKKGNNDMITGLKRLAATYLTVHAAVKIFKAIMNSTQQTGDLLRREISGIKSALDELSRTVATGNWAELGRRLREARQAGMDYADAWDVVGDRERELRLIETEREGRMIELAKIYRNTGLVGAEGYRKRKEAAEEYIKLAGEGERDAVELLKIRLDAELDFARQKLGYSQDLAEDEKKRINEQIINNIRSAKSFDENKNALKNYQSLVKQLTEAEKGVPVRELIGEVWIETSRKIDTKKVDELKASIAAIPPEIRSMSETYEQWGNITDDTRIRITNAYDAIGKKQNEVANSTIRANTMAELSSTMLAKEEGKNLDDRQKKLEEFLQASLQLQDQYDKDQIDRLEGPERFAAERDYQLQQLALLRTHLESKGDLTEDHLKWLAGLEESANIEFMKQSADYDQKAFDEMVGHGDKVRELERQLQEEALDLIEDNEEEKLKLKIKFAKEDIKILEASDSVYAKIQADILRQRLAIWNKEIDQLAKGDKKTFWDVVGLGDNPEAQEAIKNSVDTFRGVLDDIFSARVEDAQRTRELLDTQISETQRALEAEMDMMRDGYANNVDAKKKELEDLKIAREKALKEEEKAIKAQRALDTVSQLSSLISASADIFKSLAKLGPVGVAVAIATIGTMFGAFAAAKVKASQATKLAEGGTGTDTGVITGKRHSQGGERFLDHVEVERGERWGVLNRRASAKYGKAFSEIVTSFNKDRVPIDAVTGDPNIIVDVNQTNERLDRVHGELVRLNSKFGTKRERTDLGDRIVEKLGPHKTRIIRK